MSDEVTAYPKGGNLILNLPTDKEAFPEGRTEK